MIDPTIAADETLNPNILREYIDLSLSTLHLKEIYVSNSCVFWNVHTISDNPDKNCD